MAKFNYKFLVFHARPTEKGGYQHLVAQVNVTDKTRKEILNEWDNLLIKYPSDTFLSNLTETNQKFREFQDDPENFNNKQIKY